MFGRLKEQPSPQSLVGTTTPIPDGDSDGPSGPSESLILLLFTILTLAATTFVLLSNEEDALHDPTQRASRGEVTGLSRDSMFRKEKFAKVLAKVSDSKHPLIASVRVSAVRVDLTVRNEDGYRKLVGYDPSLKATVNDFNVGTDETIVAQQIDAGAPERIVRAVAELSGQPESAVDYVTISGSTSNDRTWYVALNRGPARVRQWIAAEDGTDLRKPGELSQKQKKAEADRKRQYEQSQRRLQRALKRRSACLGKAQSATAAARCVQRNPIP